MIILNPQISRRQFIGGADDSTNTKHNNLKEWLLKYNTTSYDNCIVEVFETKKEAESRLQFLLEEMIRKRWDEVKSMSDAEIRDIMDYDDDEIISDFDIAYISLAGLEGWDFTEEEILELI